MFYTFFKKKKGIYIYSILLKPKSTKIITISSNKIY